MAEVWLLVIGLVIGNPDGSVVSFHPLLRIERIEVPGTRSDCEKAADRWLSPNVGTSGFARAFATCVRKAP